MDNDEFRDRLLIQLAPLHYTDNISLKEIILYTERVIEQRQQLQSDSLQDLYNDIQNNMKHR